MPRLFTYVLKIDSGAAPNPFAGMCSLAICKPKIRRVAQVGDWVAGVGSKNAPSEDLSGHLVYAMRVEQRLPMEEYDRLAPTHWPSRIPDVGSSELWRRLGDCIYDYSAGGEPRLRKSVHETGDIATDLSGVNVLLSRHFYYFGRDAIRLPDHLQAICPGRNHMSDANAPRFDAFVSWIETRGFTTGRHGDPDYSLDWGKLNDCGGCGKKERTNKCGPAC